MSVRALLCWASISVLRTHRRPTYNTRHMFSMNYRKVLTLGLLNFSNFLNFSLIKMRKRAHELSDLNTEV